MKVKSPKKLIFSILLAQSAGLVGSFFTVSAIPTWYVFLNKPVFSPPNWLFGPVWAILYTFIGISMYLIWSNKKGSLRLFFFHLFLNTIWSPIFFGIKNLGLAFFVILLMDFTLILIIKNFYKINKTAALILIPYLLWINFASILNFSIWKLNSQNITVFAQQFNLEKAKNDYIFAEDQYEESLKTFNLKKDSYLKNQTLSLKEETRIALLNLLPKRAEYMKTYLTVIRTKIAELTGLTSDEKQLVFSKIDPEVVYYQDRNNSYQLTDNLETLLSKSREEDQKYRDETLPVVYFSLVNIGLGDAVDLKNKNVVIYTQLRTEAENLIKLGRADSDLFDRWFKDIDLELNKITDIENDVRTVLSEIFSKNKYQVERVYEDSIEILSPISGSLVKLNEFVFELETTISEKR